MKKKRKAEHEYVDLMTNLMNDSSIHDFMESIFNHPSMKVDENNLGRGMRLVPLDFESNSENYSHLYKDGVKLSDVVFRRGGLCSGFGKNDYCALISYPEFDGERGGWGNHCIVDLNGEIALNSDNQFDWMYYKKGVIATKKDVYYNLLTGKPIVAGRDRINSERFLFVEKSYGDDYTHGVYKIEYATGEFEIFN